MGSLGQCTVNISLVPSMFEWVKPSWKGFILYTQLVTIQLHVVILQYSPTVMWTDWLEAGVEFESLLVTSGRIEIYPGENVFFLFFFVHHELLQAVHTLRKSMYMEDHSLLNKWKMWSIAVINSLNLIFIWLLGSPLSAAKEPFYQ